MPSTILIMGATGTVGGATLRALGASGLDAVAFVRNPRRAAELHGKEQPVRVGDLGDSDSVAAALDGIDCVLLCSGNDPAMREQQLNAVAAIGDSDVRRVVKISASPVATGDDSPSRVGRDHAEIDAALRATGRETVAIRPNVFMHQFLAQAPAIANGVLPGPEGARVSFIDARDIGAVAAVALTADEPPPILELTGPEALTWYQVADAMSDVLGRPVTHHPLPTAGLAEGMRALGRPEWMIEHALELAVLLREPKAAQVTDTVEELTGRPPRPLTQFLTDNAPAFAAEA